MIQLTEKAKEEVKKLVQQQAKPGSFLRVGVKVGGCSGLSYEVNFDNELKPGDKIFDASGVMVVCDAKSALYLDGMMIDYSTGLVGAGFKFVNPNAKGSCGCGTSFAV